MKQFFTTLLLFSSICAIAQNARIKGRLTTLDDQPAEFVTITLKGTNKGAISNQNGEYIIEKIKPGSYTLQTSFIGLIPKKQDVTLTAGQELEVNFTLGEDSRQLQEVVVAAQKAEKYVAEKTSESLRLNAKLIEVPQNITVTTRQTMIDMGMLNKNDVIRTVSGITKTYGDDLDASLLIRGTSATYSTYRNGVGGPIWWNAQEDAEMIERIEFVKGPAGFMLANAEPGGLVNTVTKQPTHERINEISLGMGSYNLMRAAIDLGGEFQRNGKLTYRLNTGMQQSSKFYKMGNFNRFFVCGALKYDFTPNSSLTVEHNYVKAVTAHNSFNQISINEEFFKLPIDMAMNDPNIGNYMGADVYTRAFFQHKINDNWKLNAQVAHMTTDWDGNALYVTGLSPTKDTIYRDNSMSDWWGKLYNMQMFVDGKFNTGVNVEHKVLIGIDYGDGGEGSSYGGTWGENKFKLSIANPTYYLPKDSLRFIPESSKGTWISSNKWQALYVQDHIKIAKKVVLTLAGRYTHLVTGQDYNSPEDPDYEIADNAFTPRLGLTYLLSDQVSFYGIYDKSFLPQRGAVFGEGRLPPLTGSNTEFGAKAFHFNNQLVINASVYKILKNNVGTSDPIHNGFYLKTGQITSKGIEVDITGNLGRNLFVNANYAYTDARITKDRDSSVVGIRNYGTPDHTANAWLKYRISEGVFKGLSFGAGMQYMGNRSGVYAGWGSEFGNKSLPGYTIYDAVVSYSINKFSVGLNVYNLTNKKYASNGYYTPDAKEWFYSPGTPLNFRIQTQIRF